MAASNKELFDQKAVSRMDNETNDGAELDFGRVDRNAAFIDRLLGAKGVAAIQRAVVWLLIAHPEVKIVEGVRCLRPISQRVAAAWCRDNAIPPIRGMKCDHTAILRAVQAWIDRGVMATSADAWWLHPDRLKTWFESLPGGQDIPLFRPVVTGGDDRCEVVRPGAGWCAPVTGGDGWCGVVRPQSMSDGLIEEESSQSLNRSDEAVTTPHQAAPDITSAIASLPELPIGVWDTTRNDSAVHSLIQSWWSEHCLADRYGDLAADVSHVLIGLIATARKKANPPGYFARASQQPRGYLRRIGQEWFAKIERARSYAR